MIKPYAFEKRGSLDGEVEIDKTLVNTLEAELHMLESNGLKLLGVIAI